MTRFCRIENVVRMDSGEGGYSTKCCVFPELKGWILETSREHEVNFGLHDEPVFLAWS